ncbi:hypothetical protein LPTSP2_04600 [Leptospira ellinghausenii]|uniref:Zeta toxin domain-containing protein n=1 Tax=Leptospira ellinghausenii TaxID=1917822 RepID=A0A2P2D9B5_9LEPT|nr:zeta toxin family protein [Leptospira ellinghausenii]GBF41188.1 hypothetical protein LPTSP2_04600 [Leptospira ellinghausenii]
MRTLYLFAGPNGAGKTTTALKHIEKDKEITFVNADIIAQELDPNDVEKQAIKAGRIMLRKLDNLLDSEEGNIAFESTLSSRSFVNFIAEAKNKGFQFVLLFISLKNSDLACARVRQRVENGGHNIPEETIRRRFKKGRENLKKLYIPLADSYLIYDNSGREPILVSECFNKSENIIKNEHLYNSIFNEKEEQ